MHKKLEKPNMRLYSVIVLFLLNMDFGASHIPAADDVVDRPNCPEQSEVDDVIRNLRTIRECRYNIQCFSVERCCDTTDNIGVCIPMPPETTTAASVTSPSTSVTNTTTSGIILTTSGKGQNTSVTNATISGTSTTTFGTPTYTSGNITGASVTETARTGTNSSVVDTGNHANETAKVDVKAPNLSDAIDVINATTTSGNTTQEASQSSTVTTTTGATTSNLPDQGAQNPTGTNRTVVNNVGNDLVVRSYLLPPAWRSITFVDRKLKLNSGKIMAFDFLFEDTREFLDGMFPGMRLQIWTPHLTQQWGLPIQYTLKCEKLLSKDDVTNTVIKNGRPVPSAGQTQTGKDGTVISLDVSDVDCMRVTLDDHIGFCSTDLVLPVPYDYGTDGQVDWMYNDPDSFTRVNDTVSFRTLEALPIPATFSVGVDIMYDENC